MATEFDRSRETVCGRSITITSWYDDEAEGWRAGAPEYVHLLTVSSSPPLASSTRQQAVSRVAQILARSITPRRAEANVDLSPQPRPDAGPRIHVGGLAATVDRAALETAFVPYGQVAAVRIVSDRGTARPFAFVEMTTVEEAERAIEALHGSLLAGDPITVRKART